MYADLDPDKQQPPRKMFDGNTQGLDSSLLYWTYCGQKSVPHSVISESVMLVSRIRHCLKVDVVNKEERMIHRRIIFNESTIGKVKHMSNLQCKHLGGLCLAYLLSSYPGPRPLSRVGHS